MVLPSMTGLSSLQLASALRPSGVAEASSNPVTGGSLLPSANTALEEDSSTERKRGKKKEAKVTVLSDSAFIEGKNKNLSWRSTPCK